MFKVIKYNTNACPKCKMMKSVLAAANEIIPFELIEKDYRTNSEEANKYCKNIVSAPIICFFKDDALITSVSGPVTKDKIIEIFNSVKE